MTFNLLTNGGTPTFGPLGKVYLNGGLDNDTLTNGNPNVSLPSGFETII